MPNLPFPPLEDDGSDEAANAIVNYQIAAANKQDPTRLQRFVENEEARFTIASKPYMAPPLGANPETPFFEPIRVDNTKIKLANRNETAPIIESEVARLIGSTSEPSVIPSKATTLVHRAAKRGEEILDDILLELGWVDVSHKDADNAVSYGTSWLLAGWENDYTDMRKGPALVHACDNMVADPDALTEGLESPGLEPEEPGEGLGAAPAMKKCGWVMLAEGGEDQAGGGVRFGGDIADDMISAGVGNSVSQPGDPLKFATLHECPECGGKLTKRRSLPSDVGSGPGMDVFGADLMEEKPLPKVFVQGYPDIDVFPIGNGRVTHGYQPEVTIETIVPIDWLMQRYEHAGKVKPMSLAEMDDLGRWHPAGLEMWGYEGHTLYTDQRRWAAYRITIRQPFKHPDDEEKSEPLGRLMISANKTVLFNGPLLFEYEGPDGEEKLIPRMRLFPFANKAQNNSVNGISTTSRLLGPQKALDAMLTQFQWDMAENGSPTIAMPKGTDIEGQGDGFSDDDPNPAIPNPILRYDPDSDPPTVIGGKVTHQDWQPFTAGIVEHMQRTTAQSQLDQGKAANGAPSASAQMYIGQRLDETRKPKGQRWAERLSALFSYMLECVCAVYTEKRQFKVVNANENRTFKDFCGADLMCQTNVKVTTKPSHDNEAFQRQNITEAIAMNVGLIDLSTVRQRIKVAKIMGLPDELAPENQQITQAQNEFLEWTLDDPPVRPVAKKRIDNHVLHHQTHMEDFWSPAGESLRRFLSMHELATYGWWDDFVTLMKAEMRLKTMGPAPMPVRILIHETGADDTNAESNQAKLYAADQKLIQRLATLPKHPQDRIEKITMAMMEAYPDFQALAMAPDDQDDARALTIYLAHDACHQWMALEAQLEAQMAAAPDPRQAPGQTMEPGAAAPAGATTGGAPQPSPMSQTA